MGMSPKFRQERHGYRKGSFLNSHAAKERAGAHGVRVGVTRRARLPDNVAGEQRKARGGFANLNSS
jgi:hypothetical protein